MPPSAHARSLRPLPLRQERLSHEPVLQLSGVMDEAVLLRGVGDRGIMRAQLASLAQAAELPNVALCILPLDRKAALAEGCFVILGLRLTSSA
jgi:Domain of unknown function (DUF5753)